MKHALTILFNAAEAAETNAPKREAAADAYARDGAHERAENLRSQAALDREVAAECREVIPLLQIMATVKQATEGLSEDELREGMKALLAEVNDQAPL
jgi:hypothetical protein